MKKIALCLVAFSAGTLAFAAKPPKTADMYYSEAAFQYIENRLPTAEITCKEGLNHFPGDAKLQMLADRIEESKNEQQKQNRENNPESNRDKNGDSQDSEQNRERDQNQNGDNSQNENQEQSGNSSNSESSSSAENSMSNGNGSGESSGDSGDNPASADSGENSGESSGSSENENGEVPPGGMNPAEASQLLKDFDEEHGERKPWKPAKGMARPEKDW